MPAAKPIIAVELIDPRAEIFDRPLRLFRPVQAQIRQNSRLIRTDLVGCDLQNSIDFLQGFFETPRRRCKSVRSHQPDLEIIRIPLENMVSNLPYYAAMPIMKRLLSYAAHITDMTLMMQKEVVDRLVAEPGNKEYGSLTVFTQFHCRVERLLEVDKTCFSPAPKIDSSVIRLTPLSQPPVQVDNMKTFFHVVHAAFFHKRKMLKNNLRTLQKQFPLDFQKIEDAGINLSRRGETLSLEDFASISNLLPSNHD